MDTIEGGFEFQDSSIMRGKSAACAQISKRSSFGRNGKFGKESNIGIIV